MTKRKGQRGITLMETAITIVVIVILASGFGTALYSTVSNARDEAVINQLEGIKKAIAGERVMATGEKSGLRYGYIGDMGMLPASLAALETAGSQQGYTVDPTLQLAAGWRGPYIAATVSRGLIDPWGGALAYSTVPGTSDLTGAPVAATVRSLGADGQFGTPDDHIIEIYRAEAFSKLMGFVKDSFGSTLAGIGVTISYASSGVAESLSTTTDNEGLYTFDGIPHGARVLQLAPKIVYQHGTAFTTGGNRQHVEFIVENLDKLSISITSAKLTWTTDPPSDFKRLLIGGSEVFSGTAASGTTIGFSPRSLAGTGVIQEPLPVDVTSLVMQVPDAIIGSVGTGGSLKFDAEDFEEVGANNDVDMTGVTFTIEFSDGSKTVCSPVRKK